VYHISPGATKVPRAIGNTNAGTPGTTGNFRRHLNIPLVPPEDKTPARHPHRRHAVHPPFSTHGAATMPL